MTPARPRGSTSCQWSSSRAEELASLLRRIGRLPPDKAIEVARQLCAGLAAAHEVGVLHRDLKPANVMIDERGNMRVTDFGLASLAEELRDADVIAGTPVYMAPEQLAGREVTTKSDIYALGLVLYELFTGKRAFEARMIDDLLRLRETSSTPTSPSAIVKDIDPLIERDILIGAALAGGMMLCNALAFAGLRWLRRAPEFALNPGDTKLDIPFVARFVSQTTAGLLLAFVPLFLLLLFVAIMRRERPALVALWLLVSVIHILLARVQPLMTPFMALLGLLVVAALYRYGLLATVCAMFFLHLWVFYPMTTELTTTELTAWYATHSLIALIICLALAAYGFDIALAGQPLFGKNSVRRLRVAI